MAILNNLFAVGERTSIARTGNKLQLRASPWSLLICFQAKMLFIFNNSE